MDMEEAKKLGEELVDQLGVGWEVIVTRNMDLFPQALSPCKRYLVYLESTGTYVAVLGELGRGRWIGRGKTPRAAVRNVREVAQREVNYVLSLVENPPDHFGAKIEVGMCG